MSGSECVLIQPESYSSTMINPEGNLPPSKESGQHTEPSEAATTLPPGPTSGTAPNPSQPTPDPSPPATNPSQSTPDASKPTSDPSQPTTDPSQPAPNPSQSTPDPSKPTSDPSQPTPDPPKPTPNPSQPTPDPSQPAPTPSQPTPDPSKEAPQHTYKGVPTVKPAQPFNPKQDADVLHKRMAMKGLGTDEDTIIQVLCNRTNTQRQQIAQQYRTIYNKDLIQDLKSELSGDFTELIEAMMTPTAEYQAMELHNALQPNHIPDETNALPKPWETNEHPRIHGLLVELMCSATNKEIHNMCAAYQRLFNQNLDCDMTDKVSSCFQRLLVSLCKGGRSEDYTVDQDAAVSDAKALLHLREQKVITDESMFKDILCTRSYPQLIEICKAYQHLSSHGIEEAIKREFPADIEYSVILDFIESVTDKAVYFAQKLHDRVAGAGTRDRDLRRIISLRSEIDMGDIKEAFSHEYGKSLEDFIEGDTSGDYKKCLLALINY